MLSYTLDTQKGTDMMSRKGKLILEADLKQELREARELLLSDPKTLKRKVRNVAAGRDDDPRTLALFTLAAGRRFNWTPDDWNIVLDKLDDCNLTVAQWLKGTDNVRQL